MMTTSLNWITDRPPTIADADRNGNIAVKKHPSTDCFVNLHWSLVKPGMDWRRTRYWKPLPKIKLGQRWRRADGEVVTVFYNDHTDSPWRIGSSPEKSFWYKHDGIPAYASIEKHALVELVEDAFDSTASVPATSTPQPRRIVSITRTVQKSGDHTIDAVADDGTAWWMVAVGTDGWTQLPALPARDA